MLPTDVLIAAMGGGGASDRAAATGGMVGQAEPGVVRETAPEPGIISGNGAQDKQVISLMAEEMLVGKALVETARVRLRRETEEHVQTVSVPLTDVRWEVERIPVEQIVDAQPEIRQAGETIIFPLVEERLVVKRELWLREEVHVRKVTSVVEKTADFPVKRDVLVEERTVAEER